MKVKRPAADIVEEYGIQPLQRPAVFLISIYFSFFTCLLKAAGPPVALSWLPISIYLVQKVRPCDMRSK
jgi:hypothetical protein